MGKYCTDCAKEIEEKKEDNNRFPSSNTHNMESWNFNEVVRCGECLAKKGKGSFGGF